MTRSEEHADDQDASQGMARRHPGVSPDVPAVATNEKAQAAFLRMRTIHWYDLEWSKDTIAVNEDFTLSGKFRVFKDWPEAVAHPNVSFLNVGSPGPVVIRTASYINDVFVPRSVGIQLGGDYNFSIEMKGRRP
jgi:methane/ammonia monooxygenase subunit B